MKTLLLPNSLMMMGDLVQETAVAVIIDLNKSWTNARDADPDFRPGGILLEQAKERHLRELVEMARRGEICPRHVLFHTRFPDFKPEDVDQCMISFSDAQVFCRSLDLDLQTESAPADAAPATEPKPAGPKNAEEWKIKARERAAEIIRRQREQGLFPNQGHIADEIAKQFRAEGVVGADRKPLTGAYIKRHALKGVSSTLSTPMRRGK